MAGNRTGGVTLVELMLVLTITAILLLVSTASFTALMERARLVHAAESLRDLMQYARTEAIKRNRPLTLSLGAGATWCAGLNEDAGCDCSLAKSAAAGACTLREAGEPVLARVVGRRSEGVTLDRITYTDGTTTFEPIRGTAKAGSVYFSTTKGLRLRVVLSGLGRVRICSPDGAVGGFGPCD